MKVTQRTLSTLGYDEILQRLANQARMPLAKERCQRPSFPTQSQLAQRLDETGTALLYGRSFDWPAFPDYDIWEIVQKAVPLDACLPASQLLTLARWCVSLLEIQRYRELAASCSMPSSLLDPLFSAVDSHPGLVRAIRRAIDEQGEIDDRASPELGRIRHEIRELSQRATRILQRMLAETRYEEVWQDRLVSIRDGRYVVPVKAGQNGRIRGIILDRSASGETLFVEPDAVVGIDNGIKELQLAEEREIRRILLELTAELRQEAKALSRTREAVTELDYIFARARLAERMNASRPEFVSSSQPLEILEARHPLLTCTPVPIDIVFGTAQQALVISGPNTGGKTVALKTLGLFVLMAQSGLFIPASALSRLHWFESVWCAIGDDQSIEHNLSTYSAHIRTISLILSQTNEGSLVLIDEIGAGTDPREGAALGIAIIEAFLAQGVTLVVTTHYGDIKNYAYTSARIDIAGVRFDEESLKPGYQLERGIPTSSHAFSIAARLGLDNAILKRAQELVPEEVRQSEAMFKQIEEDLAAAREKKLAADEAHAAGRAARERYRRELDRLRQEREALIDETRLAMRALLRQSETEVNALLDALRQRTTVPNAKEIALLKHRLHALADQMPPLATAPQEDLSDKADLALAIGDRVEILALAKEGEVLQIDGEKVNVAIGSFTTSVARTALKRIGASRKKPSRGEFSFESEQAGKSRSPGISLDIRGLRAAEAEERLRHYLDEAGLANLALVTIIHGKGSGSLRETTQRVLKEHPFVTGFHTAAPAAGGTGATEVTIGGAR